jgi:hypothetical protein
MRARRASAILLDDEDDRAHDLPIVHPRDPVRQREVDFDPAHLRLGEQKQISHGEAPPPPP